MCVCLCAHAGLRLRVLCLLPHLPCSTLDCRVVQSGQQDGSPSSQPLGPASETHNQARVPGVGWSAVIKESLGSDRQSDSTADKS